MHEAGSRAALAGRVGGFRTHALHDSREITAPARKASETKLNARLLAEIDPGHVLPESERQVRLRRARRAHFTSLALRRGRKGQE